MKKKILMTLWVGTMAAVMLAGCGNTKQETSKQDATSQETTKQEETDKEESLLDDYNQLLQTATDQEQLYQYIDEHIDSATKAEADQLVNGLLGFVDNNDEIDYERLLTHKDKLSDEMKAFTTLMEEEEKDPSVGSNGIQLPLADLLNRCLAFEKQVTQYPNGLTRQYAYEKYEFLLEAAITGNYDGSDPSTNYYINTNDLKHIDGLAVDEYQNFVNENGDTVTGKILTEYLQVMTENKNELNDQVAAFYKEIGQKANGYIG